MKAKQIKNKINLFKCSQVKMYNYFLFFGNKMLHKKGLLLTFKRNIVKDSLKIVKILVLNYCYFDYTVEHFFGPLNVVNETAPLIHTRFS